MSSFYGIFYRDGRSVSQKEAQKMQQTFDWWKPDESDFIIQDNILLGQATLYNTPESKYEHLPLKKANYILAMDARIDNREELAKELELPNKPLQEIGDSEFILASYRKWGKECADKLLGDFAFVIWDEAKQELFCARDIIGIKPIYYTVTDNKIIFSNDLQSLTKLKCISLEINDRAIANYITNKLLTDKKITFYKHIHKIEPASFMIVSKQKIHTTIYWKINKIKKNTQITEEETINKLKKLLYSSVKARIRSDYRITSHLSGGIDSSTITILASQILKKTQSNHLPLLVFNWIQPPSKDNHINHYEWKNSLNIAQQENLEHYFVQLSITKFQELLETKSITFDSTRLWYEYPIREEVQKYHSRTILSGWGGDELISNHAHAIYCDHFIHFRWKKLYHECKLKISKKRKPFKMLLSIMYHKIFVPLLPDKLYCYLPKKNCSSFDISLFNNKLHPYIKKELKKKNYIFSRHTAKTIHEDLLRAWENGHIQGRIESWHNASFEYQINYTYPLLDKRIIEFTLSIPSKYFFKNGIGRYIFKMATADILPSHYLKQDYKLEPNRVKKIISLYQKTINKLEGNYSSTYDKYFNKTKLKEISSIEEFSILLPLILNKSK